MQAKRLRFLIAGLVSLGLAGCQQGHKDMSDPDSPASAATFVACLKAAGMQAKVSETGGMVMVPGSAMDVDVQAADGGLSATTLTSTASGEDSALLGEVDDAGSWVAPANSAALSADRALQAAYRSCEAKHPSFRQPELAQAPDSALESSARESSANALGFTKCARSKGFSWVTDPQPGAGIVELPDNLTADEFRAVLDACWDPEKSFGWSTGANVQGLMDALQDLNSVSGGGAS